MTLLLLCLLLQSCRAPTQTIAQAQQSYRQNHVAAAETAFAQIADDDRASSADRGESLRQLARIAWLVDADRARALKLLDRATSFERPCDTAQLRARVLDESGAAAELRRQLSDMLKHCTKLGDIDDLRARAADAELNAGAHGDAAALDRAATVFASMSDDARSSLRGSALMLELGLLRRDPQMALSAWRNYFWLTDGDAPQALAGLKPTAWIRFSRALAANASTRDQLELVDLLIRAGFLRPAERFAARSGLARTAAGDPLWRKASAYFAERHRLEAILLASNRRVARGGKAANLHAAYMAMERRLAAAANLSGANLSGNRRIALMNAYGLYGTVGLTEGFPSLHLGHVVERRTLPVDQYGHHAAVRYLAVDNLISNGYLTWLSDGDAADGGWTEDGPIIVQVRSVFAPAPLNAWRAISDPATRADYVQRINRRSAEDRAVLAAGRVAYLPGLQMRLRLQFVDQLAVKARALARGGDVRRAYLDEYSRADLERSIIIHEGRHALDELLLPKSCADDLALLEYRAKLSELALGDYPRLSLYNIDDTATGGPTPHGLANQRVLAAFARWAASHPAAIRGYDRRLPPLAQLDKLSDAQMHAIAKSLDPLARSPSQSHNCK